MKRRYLFICLLSILLLTGCNAKYSLEIKDGKIKEIFSIVENSDSDVLMEKNEFGYSFYDYSKQYGEEWNIDTSFDAFYSIEECKSDCSFYEKKYINDNGKVGFELSHEFTFDEYSSSTIGKEMIPGFTSSYDGRYLIISAGPKWNYFKDYDMLEKIDLSIETNYKVVSTNIKKVSEGKYEGPIDGKDEKLFITIDTNTIVTDYIDSNDSTNLINYLIIFLIALFVGLIVCVISNRKKYH